MEKKKRAYTPKQNEYSKRYREKVRMKTFKVDLYGDRFELIDNKLKEDGITKKQFLEDAIDKYLNKG